MSRIDLREVRRARFVASLLVSLAIFWASATSASADFLHVSPTGSDSNDCRFHPPEVMPCATIQRAVDLAKYGDWVDIDPGVYSEEVVVDQPGVTLIGPAGTTNPGSPHAVIDGGSGAAILLQATAVSLRQLKVVAGAAGTPIRAPSGDIGGLRAQENIISGGTSGVLLEAEGEDVSVGYNQIENAGDGIRVSAADFEGLTIQWNHFSTSIDDYAVRTDASSTIAGLQLEGNELPAPVRIAGLLNKPSKENDISENTFESAQGPQLAINGLEARLMHNSFEGNGAVGCLQILGSQDGLTPSSNILVSLENEFSQCNPFGIELGPGVDDVSVFGNLFPGTYDGVVASGVSPWHVSGRAVIEGNRMVGTTHLAVVNHASGTLWARENWWGCNAGPGGPGCDSVGPGVDSGDPVKLLGLIGPLTEEDGFIELPTGTSIALDPGGKAEVAAVLSADGTDPHLGVPTGATPVGFSSSMGTMSSASSSLQNGYTFSNFTAGPTPGTGSIVLSMDNQRTLVPVTIRGAAGGGPLAAPVKPARAPVFTAARKRTQLAGNRASVGSIFCADACRIRPGRVRIAIADRSYRGTATPNGALAAGATAPIRVTLPRPALRALKGPDTARVRVTVSVTGTGGQTWRQAFSATVRR